MTLKPLITASEGYPALERLVHAAQSEILMSFRIFDPETRIRAPELRDAGLETWADLLANVTERGVVLRVLLADFDPLFTADLHRMAWRSARHIETHVNGDSSVLCAPHGQRAGPLWRLLMQGKIKSALDNLRQRDPAELTPVEQAILRGSTVLRPVTIHQKFAVADGKNSVIGGLDINERRYDTKAHDRPADETWHDVSMHVENEGFGRALRSHFADAWNAAIECGARALGREAAPIDAPPSDQPTTPALVRTISAPCQGLGRLSPENRVAEHESTLINAFSEAQDSIYIETQFLRHKPIADALVAAGERKADLSLIVIMPPFAERVLFNSDFSWDAKHAHALQVRALTRIREAFGDRVALIAPGRPVPSDGEGPALHEAEPIYVHSKVTVIDDAFGLVGSANLNGRSLRWDTEASVLFRDPDAVQKLRKQLARKWLWDDLDGKDIYRAATWREMALNNAGTPPAERTGFILPYPLDKVRRFSRTIPLLPDDMF